MEGGRFDRLPFIRKSTVVIFWSKRWQASQWKKKFGGASFYNIDRNFTCHAAWLRLRMLPFSSSLVWRQQLLLSPFGREHTVTSLFLYVSRSALTAFGILCRWAGVRGTIPQPIVVTSVIAAILSSRGDQRVLSLALTLFAMRLVGEFIHGSLHGNEFWDDEYDYKSHDWKDKRPVK